MEEEDVVADEQPSASLTPPLPLVDDCCGLDVMEAVEGRDTLVGRPAENTVAGGVPSSSVGVFVVAMAAMVMGGEFANAFGRC